MWILSQLGWCLENEALFWARTLPSLLPWADNTQMQTASSSMIYDVHALYSRTQAKQQQMAKHKELSMNGGVEKKQRRVIKDLWKT